MPKRPNVENAEPQLMREAELHVGGYPMALVTAFEPDLVTTDDTTSYFGGDQDLYSRTLDGATLNLTAANATENQPLLEVANNIKPYQNAIRAFYPNTKIKLDVTRQFKNENSNGYHTVEFYENWKTVVRTPQGDPKAKGSIQMTGRSEAPVRVVAKPGQMVAILFKVLTGAVANGAWTSDAGSTAKLAADIVQIPDIPLYKNGQKHAFSIEVQKRDGAGKLLKFCRIPVTADNVAADGNVTIMAQDLYGTRMGVNEITHVYVAHLWAKDEDDVATDGLLGSGLAYDGRLD